MDPQRGGPYDPSQPWAVTDALLGILARTMLKSTYQTRLSAENHSDAKSGHPIPAQPQTSQTKKSTAVSSQFWANESKLEDAITNGTSPSIENVSGSGPVGSANELPASHHSLSRASPAARGSPESGVPNSYNHSIIQSHSHNANVDNGEDVGKAKGSTPGADTSVSPMMIDPNLAVAWQGEGHGHEHEHDSFLHQYSDMGGDYASVPQAMIDPNLALMHEHDDFRHERHLEDGNLDEFEGGHHLSIPSSIQGGLKRQLSSPFFANVSPTKKSDQQPSLRRRQRGTVSCIPSPRLTAPYFGLIQEQLAHDPFWLLIAVTFLIRTKGKAAIPVFWQVMQRFPSPAMLGDEANVPELTNMIRHLGLSSNRVALIRRYAHGWMKQPPHARFRYRVKGYACRDTTVLPDLDTKSSGDIGSNFPTDLPSLESAFPSQVNRLMDTNDGGGALAQPADDGDLEAWEIGHLTQGRYAIDSWRIFCRDALLGRALDWKGAGREPEFQPEWMRVIPQDKELRAYLRWMWMKEGWQWDAVSGERTVLGDEMRRAVEAGRVMYNDDGELEIVGPEPQLQ